MSEKNNQSQQPSTQTKATEISIKVPDSVGKAKNGHVSTSPPPKVAKPSKK